MSKYIGKICLDNGSTTECSVNFINNINPGFFYGSSTINICISGISNLQISSSLITSIIPISLPTGSLTGPAIQFNSASNGIYLSGTNAVTHVINGSPLLLINTTGLQVTGIINNGTS